VLARRTNEYKSRKIEYKAKAQDCNSCALKEQCTPSNSGRIVQRNFDEEYLDRVRAYHQTAAYQRAIRKRKVWVEPLFAEAKQWHGLRRFKLRGLEKVNSESLLIAAGQNLKRLLREWGWGQRPGPNGVPLTAIGATFPLFWHFRRSGVQEHRHEDAHHAGAGYVALTFISPPRGFFNRLLRC
jgi:hypothetical protein